MRSKDLLSLPHGDRMRSNSTLQFHRHRLDFHTGDGTLQIEAFLTVITSRNSSTLKTDRYVTCFRLIRSAMAIGDRRMGQFVRTGCVE